MSLNKIDGGIVYEAGDGISNSEAARADFIAALSAKHLWLHAAWRDIYLRYMNSKLGPLWITISMGIFIGCFSIIGSTLFSISLDEYLPFLSLGIVIWMFLSATLAEGSDIFISHAHIILNSRVPYLAFIFRLVTRNLIILCHNALIFLIVAIFFVRGLTLESLMFVPGLLVLVIFSSGLALLLATIGTKYRDIPQLVTSAIQVSFFLTPVMWNPDIILRTAKRYILDLNPLHHLLSIVRNPLLGQPVEPMSWAVSISIAILSVAGGWFVFKRYRRRLSYWL